MGPNGLPPIQYANKVPRVRVAKGLELLVNVDSSQSQSASSKFWWSSSSTTHASASCSTVIELRSRGQRGRSSYYIYIYCGECAAVLNVARTTEDL